SALEAAMKGNHITIGYGDVATPEPESLTISADIAARLVNGETIQGLNRAHSFDDVLQHLWDNTDDTTEMDRALQSIALGAEGLPLARLRKLLNRAADEYAERIEADVVAAIAEKKRGDKAEWLAGEQESTRCYESG